MSEILQMNLSFIANFSFCEDQVSVSSQQPVMESVEVAAFIVPASVSGIVVLVLILVLILVIISHVTRKKREGKQCPTFLSICFVTNYIPHNLIVYCFYVCLNFCVLLLCWCDINTCNLCVCQTWTTMCRLMYAAFYKVLKYCNSIVPVKAEILL